MNSDHILDLVDDYVHGALEPEEAKRVAEHIVGCRVCQTALEEAEKRQAALESLPVIEASESLVRQTVDRTFAGADRRTKLLRTVIRFSLAAAAIAILAIGMTHIYFFRLTPSPYDLRVLGQDSLLAGSPASLRVALIDRRTGRTVNGAPVEISLRLTEWTKSGEVADEVTLTSFSTGDDRGAAFTLPDWPSSECHLRVTAAVDGQTEELVEKVKLKRSARVALSCDKPLYQPGQVIRMRALALRQPNLKPVADDNAWFTVEDPKGNVIFESSDKTSKFGIVAADCPLATEIIEGAYRLECYLSDGTRSERTVEVRKYVLPKFKIALATDKSYYAPGEEVKATVQADYFFGKPVAKGRLDLEVRGKDAADFVVAKLQSDTDESGKAELKFRLPDSMFGREQDGGNARVELAVSLTDAAGQAYSTSLARTVTANPIQIELVPENGSLVPRVDNRLYVMTTYPDGRPAKAQVRFQASSARGAVANPIQSLETNELGVAMATANAGATSFIVSATDSEGRRGHANINLPTPEVIGGDFLLRTDRAVFSSGDTMTLSVIGGGNEPVYIDLLKDGQTMLTQTIDVAEGKGEATIDLPAEIFGAVNLVAYRFGAEGLPVRKSRAVFIRQPSGLQITASLDAAEYRPGGKATVKLSLADGEGKPTPGAISLAAVDEAVFAMLNQSAGLERNFFLLEAEILRPVYTIYSQWTPEVYPQITAAERGEFEQAIFARTATAAAMEVAQREAFFTGSANTRQAARFPAIAPNDEGLSQPTFDENAWTLSSASFPMKATLVRQRRQDGLAAVGIAWTSFFACIVLGAVLAFAIVKPRVFLVCAVVTVCLALLVGPIVLLGLYFTVRSPTSGRIATTSEFGALAPRAMMAPAGAEADWAEVASTSEMSTPLTSVPMSGQDQPIAQPPRLRQWFPETLLWKPEIVTDDAGEASVEVEIADSITQWRLSASAVSAGGQLGAADFPIKVFQPFFVDLNLPVALTRNDQVSIPLVVYNYLDSKQTVKLEVEAADWFERTGEGATEPLSIELGPSEIRAASLPIRVLKAGKWKLQVTASAPAANGQSIADAISREIEVLPDGRRREQIVSGTLDLEAEFVVTIPENAIPGSVKALVKFYPSAFSQVVEGLDSVFQMPHGCFEQTSSTTYPNVLALQYLKRTGKASPEIEAKARQYIHLGYQRLLTFEVNGGGFDWYGNPPANVSLTAYGLLEFSDMAEVHDVDSALIERTRNWLLAQGRHDGSWSAGGRNFHVLDAFQSDADLALTAYVAWALANSRPADFDNSQVTLDFLLNRQPATINDPYVLALVTCAIAAIDDANCQAYLDRLMDLMQVEDGGKRVFWRQPQDSRTMFYGSGASGDIETTAMAALALLAAKEEPTAVRSALAWLVEQKDARGTWHSTQATVLALKALIEGTGKPLGDEKPRRLEVSLNGESMESLEIPADQAEVMQLLDLSSRFTSGEHRLSLREPSGGGTMYQIVVSYHVPESDSPPAQPNEPDPLSIDLAYDRTRLAVDETVAVTATVTNQMDKAAPMVILDLPIPGGFVLEGGELDELVGSGTIAKFEITPRQAIVYLRELPAGAKRELRYRLRATMPVKVSVPSAAAYEYYNPAIRAISSAAAELEAT